MALDAVSKAKIDKLNEVEMKNKFQRDFMESMNVLIEKDWNFRGKQKSILDDIYKQHFADEAVEEIDIDYPNGLGVKSVGCEYGVFYNGAKIGVAQTVKEDAEYLAQWLSAAIIELLDIHDRVAIVTDKVGGEVIDDPGDDYPGNEEDFPPEEDEF